MLYLYFMAGENKHRRKRIMQLNTLGPGKRRSPVPPSSVLTISAMSCQRGTALCPLPLGCGPQIKYINKTKMASTVSVTLWHESCCGCQAPSLPLWTKDTDFIPGLLSKITDGDPRVLMVPCVKIHISAAAKADWNMSQRDHSFFLHSDTPSRLISFPELCEV